ncbi:hypothetical protein GGR50DRAFT_668253 [Xylaria sp. CBS 124048]|nr:hypothetical protein GGR50DRAFT_668253 [Xylaria sp. CBS 124048]
MTDLHSLFFFFFFFFFSGLTTNEDVFGLDAYRVPYLLLNAFAGLPCFDSLSLSFFLGSVHCRTREEKLAK